MTSRQAHPAHGVIGISRVSGRHRLFGSDFTHQHFISISISTATAMEGFGVQTGVKTDVMSDEEIVEVLLSEAQFGRMISSMNIGSGVPCTLNHVGLPNCLAEYEGKSIPPLEAGDIRKTHKDEIKETVNERLERLHELEATIANWRKQKHRPTLGELDEILADLRTMHLASNFSFLQQTMEEAMEATVDEAAIEIEAHATQILLRTGLDAIHKQSLPEPPDYLDVTAQKRLGSEDS